jgi:PAS domain S-box-containing protein
VSDLEEKIIDVNKGFETLFQYTKEEVIGKSINDLIIPEAYQNEATMLSRHVMQNGVASTESIRRRKDGSLVDVSILGYPVLHDGEAIAIYAIYTDIVLRKNAENDLKKSEKKYRTYMENAPYGVFILDSKGRFLEGNKTVVRFSGCSNIKEFLSLKADDLFSPVNMQQAYEHFSRLVTEGISKGEVLIRDRLGRDRWFIVDCYKLNGDRFIGFCFDIDELKKAEQRIKKSLGEKEILLKEIHHRVKNNMQVISSLLNLQALKTKNEQALDAITECVRRVRTMALVHEKLYQSEDFTRINFLDYVRDIAYSLMALYASDRDRIDLRIEGDKVYFGIDVAVPCGLIVNELLSNALKYAFPQGWKGKKRIKVSMRKQIENEVEIIVSDNGVGLPEEVDIHHTESLGMKLVAILAEDQLDGEVTVDRNGGTTYIIKLNNVLDKEFIELTHLNSP